MLIASLPLTAQAAPGPLLWLGEIATVVFFTFFAAVIVTLIVRGSRHYDAQARIPLEGEPVEPREVR